MEKHLYTVIVDYDGGTFISQIESDSEDVNEVAITWAKSESFTEIFPNAKDSDTLIEGLKADNKMAPISQVVNVWCTAITLSTGFAIIDMVKTVKPIT